MSSELPVTGRESGIFPVVGVVKCTPEGSRRLARRSCSPETEQEIRRIFRHPPAPPSHRACAYPSCPSAAAEGRQLCLGHLADEVLP